VSAAPVSRESHQPCAAPLEQVVTSSYLSLLAPSKRTPPGVIAVHTLPQIQIVSGSPA
jgi:hypothetical protein